MRACVLDIESTGLEAVGPGFILCAVVKPLNQKCISLRYDDLHDRPGNEKHLVEKILEQLSRYDLWIGHNIENFDWPTIKSRALVLGIPFIAPGFLYDTMQAFKRCRFRTTLNCVGKPTARLDHIVDFLAFKQQKTAIYPRAHWNTVWLTGKDRRNAMDELVAHCVADVEMTEKVYQELLPYDDKATIKRAR